MSEAKVRLLCVPCAGASATMYFKWRRQLPAWIALEPIELPGRGTLMAEAFEEDFDRMVELLCIRHLAEPNMPYALYGHSMGALLSYGIAERMRVQNLQMPLALFASGSPAPSRREAGRFPDSDDDAALIVDMRKQGGTPEEVFNNPELLRLSLDVLGADYKVCSSFNYKSAGPLPLPIHALCGRDDDITASKMTAWGQESSHSFCAHWFEGGHFFIRSNEAQIISVINKALQQVMKGSVGATASVA